MLFDKKSPFYPILKNHEILKILQTQEAMNFLHYLIHNIRIWKRKKTCPAK
ncbi:MAG: hypothetical protein AVDCRST_MAG96-3407, partial [uncultured Segetibacter sp.]